MPRRRSDTPSPDDLPSLPPPARTLEGREDQLVAAAMDLVERRIHDGSASSQEVIHFLRLGSRRSQLEMKKIDYDTKLAEARIAEANSRRSSEELYERAIQAIKGYSGQEPLDESFGDYNQDLY